jgi:hypothetical protein
MIKVYISVHKEYGILVAGLGTVKKQSTSLIKYKPVGVLTIVILYVKKLVALSMTIQILPANGKGTYHYASNLALAY